MKPITSPVRISRRNPQDAPHSPTGEIRSGGTGADSPTVRRGMTRRALLGSMGAVGASAAAATAALDLFGSKGAAASTPPATSSTPASSSTNPLHQWAMVLDLRNCDGCKACTAACQQRHELNPEQEWIKVYSMETAGGQPYHMPRPCMMCEDPPCMYVCPVGATFRTDEGLVLVDQDHCIGCRTCMAACPYQARYFNWTTPKDVAKVPGMPRSPMFPTPQVKDTVGKCVWCADRLPHGELPACVAACPMGVIYIGDLTVDAATDGLGNVVKLSDFIRNNDAIRFQESEGTNPRVWYIPGHGQDLSNDTTA